MTMVCPRYWLVVLWVVLFQATSSRAFSVSDISFGRSKSLAPIRTYLGPTWKYNDCSMDKLRFGHSIAVGKQLHVLRSSKKNGVDSEDEASKGFFSRLGGDDEMFNIRTTFALVGGQAVLVGIAVAMSALLKTPNFGFGPDISFSFYSIGRGVLMTIPLGLLAWALDQIEAKIPALQDVTTATQRSVLALLGSTFKPGLGLLVAISLGVAAGLGEEMLFRGVFQYALVERLGKVAAVGLSSVVFGLLHAVTPMYAFLATLASVYFGYLYIDTGNLAVPIVTHAVYDVGALFYAHWTVANLTPKEQTTLAEWEGPGTDR